ncbi:hypothetical protein AB0F43_31230 [Kribbella sp. NPDC023972]|uniref:hypothetical protein n=1 Tax=Kribbella sp. NPDC023972 TaxID=3154795 RepID=UPI0034076F9A
MFVLNRSRRGSQQWFPRIVAVVVSAALLTTGLEVRQLAEAAQTAVPKPQVAKVASRPDLVSAVVTARSQGSKVEVESMRSQTSTTWANPDGTMTTEAHAAPIRFKTPSGAWQSVDLVLAKAADGTVAPKGHPLGLQLGKPSSAVGGVFAFVGAGSGRQVEWLAPWKLPDPTISGTTATYADVQPGVDLTLDARRSGFESDFVVKQRPSAAPVWRIPLRTKGLTARQLKDGTIEFVDAKNVVRSRIPLGRMWDAVTDEATKMPVNTASVSMSLEQVSAGRATLVIAPDAKWLLDPARVFPVTVDPTYANVAVMSTFDTFVQSGYTSDLSSTVDLRVGKNGTTTERSFLNFPGSSFQGKDVVSAYLSLMQYGATTCTATQMNLHASLPASTATRWTNMPVTSQQIWGSVSAAKGYSSACPADRVYVDMTGLAQYWSGTTDATVAVMLKAANETDANAWKRFYSTEGPADPYISLTWNRPPNAPATVETTEAIAYAAPGDTTSYMYSPSLTPWVRTKATDPDGNTVKYVFEFMTDSTTVVGTCTSSVYASGTTAGCRPSQNLPDNTLLYVRAKANDGSSDGPWTSYQARLRMGAAIPAHPQVSCPAPYDQNNSWQDNPPTADVVCTITATGTGYNAPGYINITVDGKPLATNFPGGAAGQIKITPSSDPAVAKYDVTIKKDTPGLHTITAQAETPAGNTSTVWTQNLGWGGTSLTSPASTPRITTANTIRITASGPPKGSSSSVTAKVRWRVSGYGGSDDLVGWNEDATALPVVDNGAGGVTVNTVWDTNNAKTDANLDSDPNTAGIQPTTLNDRVPVKLDIQVCFDYSGTVQCTWSQTADTTIQRVPHAFGDGFPTSDAGPGQVALWTGELNVPATDISVPGYTGALSISRSHSTYDGPTDTINGVFGPGWTAHFDGAGAGVAGEQVIDSTRLDGTLALVAGDGTTRVYQSPSGQRRTTSAFETGDWAPADENTKQDAARLTVTGTGSSTALSYIEHDGTVTTWTPTTTPSASTDTTFRAESISEPGIASKTTYAYDNGRVARILAPVPPGVTCGAYNATTPLTGMSPGCRALRFDYGITGAATGRLVNAWLDIYNPDKTLNGQPAPGMDSIKVATYTYDSAGRLATVTDPRSNLSTQYGYNTLNHLTSLKPAGQVPYQFNYLPDGDTEKLDSVTRDRPAGDPAGGTATLGKYIYAVPLSGDGVPDMTAGTVAKWNQRAAPTNGFAVFGPDHPLTTAPGAADWPYAHLQYTDAVGNTVNSASYGAGAWQLTATDYNDQGDVVRELDERALRAVIDNNMPADQLATLTVYNPDIKNGDTVITPAGTLVIDTYGPARSVALKNGALAWARPHTHTDYDEGAPNGGINPDTSLPYQLATTVTVSAQDPGTGADIETISKTLTGYTDPVTQDAAGWTLGLPGTTTTDANPTGLRTETTGDITKVTRYDAEGRVIETRQPASNGADAGTTKTIYYTAAANSTIPECGAKPQWAGLVCKTYPAAPPSSGPSLPSTTASAFTYLLSPTTVTETSGTVTRTTTTTYLTDGRLASTAVRVNGLSSSTANTDKFTTYDPATGQPTVLTAKNADGTTAGTITTGYDTWGRQVTYQPSGDAATTTVYNAAGDVAVVTDPNGTMTYSFDGTDANGRTEHRGLPTKIDVTTAGSTQTWTGAYDAGGSMTTQKLPGGITQYEDIDNTGEPIGRRYTGQVTTTNDDGSTTVDPNGGWMSWSLENDVTGRITHEWTPDGTAFTSPTGSVGSAIPYDRRYTYDNAGRLTQVNDRTAAQTGVDITATLPPCVTRVYGFDANGNRTSLTSRPANADGSCATTNITGTTTTSHAYDSADRLTTGPDTGSGPAGTYTFDALGRATTIPAGDTRNGSSAGDLTLSYYDSDGAHTITQNGQTTTYTLDAADRRAAATTGPTGSTASTTVQHYTNPSDNPGWSQTTPAGGTTSTTRYITSLTGELAAEITTTGGTPAVTLPLATPRGDIVTTVTLPASGSATAINAWADNDEYGNPRDNTTTSVGGPLGYTWMGAQQRGTDPTAGLPLMGARLYNTVTGQFTSTDPVPGGNTTRYAYPTSPTTAADPSGMFSIHWSKKWHWWGLDIRIRVYFDHSETRRIVRHAWTISAVAAAVGAVVGAAVTKNPVAAALIAAIAYIYANYILDVATNAYADGRRLRLGFVYQGVPGVWQVFWLYAREY